jgi:Glycosyl hydrolases family 16
MAVGPQGQLVHNRRVPAEQVPTDAREFHAYAAEWTPDQVAFFIGDEHVKTVGQSPGYPMQLMLGLYEFPDADSDGTRVGPYPKDFVVDFVVDYVG